MALVTAPVAGSDAWRNAFSPDQCQGFAIAELTVPTVLKRQAELRGEATCLHDLQSDRKYSYAEVDLITNRMANSLVALGLGKGSHIGMMIGNSTACLLTYLAIGKIGGVSVPINTASRGPLLAYLLDFADVAAVVAEGDAVAAIIDIAGQVPQLRTLIVEGESPPLSADGGRFRVVAHPTLMEGAAEAPGIAVAFDDPAFIMYTSGTTGPSKGNVIVQATAFLWEQGSAALCDIGADDIYYFCVQMGHVAGLFGIAYLMISIGGTIALTPRFSASRFWDDIRNSRATLAQLLGAMLNFVQNEPATDRDRDHRLRILLGGPLPKDPVAFQERFGVLLCQGYGLSDYASFTKAVPGENPDKLGSIGRAMEPFEVKIFDENDFERPAGTIGEIVVRTRYPWRSSSGYYKQPEASLAARRNDWFHTGDRGYVDADGFFFFVDRAKDSIRRRGENISAFEVERVLLTHPAIAEAAVYAVPAETSEDEVAASLVVHEGMSVDPAELQAFCLTGLAPFMVPRFVHVAETLPKTITQRVEKYKLREWASDNMASYYDLGDGRKQRS
jgi:crotonobetaine/carnitine-CoA ligase